MEFENNSELTNEEIIEKVNEIIAYIKTDEFYVIHGGDPVWKHGRDMLHWFLNMLDDRFEKRKLKLIKLFSLN